MADDIPVFPKAGSLQIHSGNIVNWNRLKRKPTQSSTEELKECIEESIRKCLSIADKNELQYRTDLVCVNGAAEEPSTEKRAELKVSVKLFLFNEQPQSVIREAVTKFLAEMPTAQYLESLILSLPVTGDDEDVTLDHIKPYWEVMEELVEEETVLFLGVADLDKNQLEELYNWAKVKPSIDQVNLEGCCEMPVDLTEFAKQHDVQLLTHSDSAEFMPVDKLKEAIKASATERDSEHWDPTWALRYSVIVKCRGIVKTKGYIFQAGRDTKKKSP